MLINETSILCKNRIVFLAANPMSTPQLALDREIRTIEERLHASSCGGMLEFRPILAPRQQDIFHAFNSHTPQVVHFSGHGCQTGEIILLDSHEAPMPLSTHALQKLFKTFRTNLQVVVFNSCHSKNQAEAITDVIDCAIGMNDLITDDAGITFTSAFYSALGFGQSVQCAFDQGVCALAIAHTDEEEVPELVTRLGVDPSQVYIVETKEVALPPDSRVVKPQTKMERVELRLDRKFDEFTPDNQMAVLRALQELMNGEGTLDINIINIREGSVLLTLELPKGYAKQLLALVESGKLDEHGAQSARLLPEPTLDDRKVCQKTVRDLMKNQGWQLLSENLFIDTVLKDEQWHEAKNARAACIHVYCKDALYPAYIGMWGADKQRQGFQELAVYMHRWAVKYLRPEIVDDVVQDALVEIFRAMGTFHIPEAILKFALQKIRDSEKKYWKPKAVEISLDIMINKNFQTKPSGLESELLYSEFRYELREAIQKSKMLHPRAQYQLEAVFLRYCECLSNEEIAEVLEKTPAQVSMLIHRGICKLRSDAHVIQLLKDFDDSFEDITATEVPANTSSSIQPNNNVTTEKNSHSSEEVLVEKSPEPEDCQSEKMQNSKGVADTPIVAKGDELKYDEFESQLYFYEEMLKSVVDDKLPRIKEHNNIYPQLTYVTGTSKPQPLPQFDLSFLGY